MWSTLLPFGSSPNVPRRYGLAMAITVIGFAITLTLNHLTARTSFQIGVVAVVLSAWIGGFGPGLGSAVLSAIGTSYAIFEPRGRLAVDNWEDVLQLMVFLVVAIVMSTLSETRNRAEASLRLRSAELEAANKELEAFSYTVSHDLRSPLRAIDGYSKIVLDEHRADLPEKARQHLTFVRQSVQQLDGLVSNVLEISRLGRQPLREELLLPHEVAQEALDQLKPEWDPRRANGQLDVTIASMPPCRADHMLLRQVYANLLDNALKFTRKTPHAVVEAGWEGTRDKPVYFVRDNGAGFDMAFTEKLFGMFQRLHRDADYEGTGVGLAIVRRIIGRHDGRLWAKALPGHGATFYFTIHDNTSTETMVKHA